MNRAILAVPLALAACGWNTGPTTPPVIVDYHAPYMSGKAPGASVRPMPRPAVAEPVKPRWPGCDKWPDDCGSSFTPPATPRQDVPAFDFTPTLPGPAPAPDPEPEAEPQPEPEREPEPQPETAPEPEPQPQPEAEKPAKEWGPA